MFVFERVLGAYAGVCAALAAQCEALINYRAVVEVALLASPVAMLAHVPRGGILTSRSALQVTITDPAGG